ncbi:GumC family protein [Acaryochloris marina]|uniref:non-specific protein-tyrosine kinase n=1 Tax=Acaryochloris marina (strain MBIC 11017) TaxID=329726 RepID=B0CEG2_ACAM1|nr:polysaccharide biosynthesis tyrosine autokinase [Acaryochloris marina]ABW26928.1 lipopolysaccharide biosynthesis protein, putative [Acaryochloris marina MBIC11017]
MTESSLYKPPNKLTHQQDALIAQTIDKDWGYGHLLSILVRRKFWFLGAFAGAIAGSIFLTLKTQPLYQSTMQLLVESNYQSKPNGLGPKTAENRFADPNVQVDLTTQLQVLAGSEVLSRAVERLQTEYPNITIEDLRSSLSFSPVYAPDSTGKGKVATKVLKATYISTQPEKTQEILETVLAVYQLYNLEQQKLRLSKGLAFIDKQLPEVRRSVLEAEAALKTFRSGTNVIDPATQAQTASAALDRIKTERQALDAQYRETYASYTSVQRQIQLAPEQARTSARLSESTRYQSLLNQIQQTELELAQKRQTLTEDHPVIFNLLNQRRDQLALLEQEVGRVLGGDAGQLPTSENQLNAGQFGDNDLSLVRQLSELQKNLQSLQARDRSLAQTEAKLTAELKQYPELLAQFNRLQPEVSTRRGTLQKLLEARQELGLEIARGGFDWQVVEAPQLGVQISPNARRNLMLGAVVGLFLGGLTAFVREAMDDKFHNSDDLGNQFPLPLLGAIPELSSADLRDSLILPVAETQSPTFTTPELFQWQPLRESLDLIYTNIQLLQTKNPYKTLMITSAGAGEGKSTLALGLAISAARLDQRVLVIDADLRNPSLHYMFNLNNHQGLSTLLNGNVTLAELQTTPQWVYMRWDESELDPGTLPPSDLSIDVLTAGPLSADPVKLLSLERMQDVLKAFENNYDLILIDSPPVLGVVDTIPIGLGCDGVVMVGRMKQVTRLELSKAISAHKRLNVIGLVANGVTPTHKNYAYLKA